MVLSLGHSHRTRIDQDLVRWGAPVARLEAAVTREPLSSVGETLEVAVSTPAAGVRARKLIRVNGVGRSPAGLSAMLRTVLFAPEAMTLVTGSPSVRRDELDDLVTQLHPTHARSLATYGRALVQREQPAASGARGRARAPTSFPTGTVCSWRKAALSLNAGQPCSLSLPNLCVGAQRDRAGRGGARAGLRHERYAVSRRDTGRRDPPAAGGNRGQGNMERPDADRTPPRRRPLPAGRARPGRLRVTRAATDGHLGTKARGAGRAGAHRRSYAAPPARRRVQRTRPGAPGTWSGASARCRRRL